MGRGIIAAMGQGIIDPKLQSFFYDLCFGHLDQGGSNSNGDPSLNAGFCGQIGHPLKCMNIFRPAIRGAAVIDGVNADENIRRVKDLGPRKSTGKEDGVSRRNISDRNAYSDLYRISILGDLHSIRKRRAADEVQIDLHDQVISRSQCIRNSSGRLKFENMALSVLKTERIYRKDLFS